MDAVKGAAESFSGSIGNFISYIVALRGREFEIGRNYNLEILLGAGIITELRKFFQSHYPGSDINMQCQMQASNILNGTLTFNSKDCLNEITWRGSKYSFDMEYDIDYHLDSGIIASEKEKITMHLRGHRLLIIQTKFYKLEF